MSSGLQSGDCGIPDNMPVSDGVHLLIPFAGSPEAGCQAVLRELQLPRLQRLLARLGEVARDEAGADSLSLPHERVLARAWGLPAEDGRIPLAAWQLQQAGEAPGTQACAWITPCHLEVGSNHLRLTSPQRLALEEADSRALLAAMQPWFAQDGITLSYQSPHRWLARGEPLRGLAAASLDRVVGRSIEGWLPQGEAGRPLRRLQQEMQMLLYTLPLNDERQAAGLLPVNSFWLDGCGALPAQPQAAELPAPHTEDGLRAAALHGDWAAWAEAWRALDADACARLLSELEGGREVWLTLAGERAARTWSSRAGGWWRRVRGMFQSAPACGLLQSL